MYLYVMTLKNSRPASSISNKVQFRKRSEYDVTNPLSIPDVLRNDGLTEESFMCLVDEYLTHRIEPEELMFVPLDDYMHRWENSMFYHLFKGVRFINELEQEPEFTSVYSFYELDEPGTDASFDSFLRKWKICIKEKCWADYKDYFGFVIEFSYNQPWGGKGLFIQHTVSLVEGDWYTTKREHPRHMLQDFSLHHIGF